MTQSWDWFSWLSKTNLDPSLIYEYGLAFTRNELQLEDLTYFNHEFLQSMGISVAKHRLEILELAKKEVGPFPSELSRFVTKAKKGIKKCISKLGFKKHSSAKATEEPKIEGFQGQWGSATAIVARNCSERDEKEVKVVEKPAGLKTRRIAKSGPLDRRVYQENFMPANRTLKLSGPLDGKLQERLVLAYRSPNLHGSNQDGRGQHRLNMLTSRTPQLLPRPNLDARPPSPKVCGEYNVSGGGDDDDGDRSLWVALFQDMKPT